jgi:ABC-2 type transport system permease protein
MFLEILKFELKGRLGKTASRLLFLLLAGVGYMSVLRNSGPLRLLRIPPGEDVPLNAPYILFFLVNVTAALGILISAGFFAAAAHRDFKWRTQELMFSLPVKKGEYIGGRLCGSLLAVLIVFSGTGVGAFAAAVLPAWNAGRIVHLPVRAYIQPYLAGVLPTLILIGALAFFLVLGTRKLFPLYAGITGLLALHLVAVGLAQSRHPTAASLVDPFGLISSQYASVYWSVAQKSERLVPLANSLLVNRLVWTAAAFILLAFAWARFRMSALPEGEGAGKRPKLRAFPERVGLESWAASRTSLGAARSFSFSARLKQTAWMAWTDFQALLRNVSFLVIMALGWGLVSFLGFRNVGLVRGTQSVPVTSQVLDVTRTPLYLFSLLVILFVSGELVWRERRSRLSPITDSLPVPEWVPFLGKWGAMALVQTLIVSLAFLSGLVVQLLQGYFRFEIPLYLTELFGIRWAYFCLLSLFALFVQVVVNRRIPAYVLTLLLVDDLMPSLGLHHHLWRFGSTPFYVYTEMNGYGPYAKPLLFYNLYWVAFSSLLIVGALLLWVRGTDRGWAGRLRAMGARFDRPKKVAAAVGLGLSVLTGGYILLNTTGLNKFETARDRNRLSALYERRYKHLDELPVPKITSVELRMDLFPEARRLHCRGRMVMVNRTEASLQDVVVHVPRFAVVHDLALEAPNDVILHDPLFGLYRIRLKKGLEPGARIGMAFDLEYGEKGFLDRDRVSDWSMTQTALVRNGSFFYNFDVLPFLGYDPFFQFEIEGKSKRAEYGLPPKARMPGLDAAGARNYLPTGKDADWIAFDAVLSTSEDQQFVTSGDLLRTWTENGRRFFHYHSDGPMLKHLAFLSARYRVRRERWRDVDIEIYYHKTHEANIGLMAEAARDSLGILLEAFGPYPFKQLRIVEFPRYRIEAECFPGVIPISEGYGFIARFTPDKVDYVYRVIAHEVGHMWWGQQVLGAWTEGVFLMSETLAQYSARLAIERKYGERLVDDFGRNELDTYLRGRSREATEEVPLARSDMDSVHVHYAKGYCVMNALRDYIGEDRLNAALRRYVRDKRFQQPPFTVSTEFLDYLRPAVPDGMANILGDWFERITFYDLRLRSAAASRDGGGRYRVRIICAAKKTTADGRGVETEVPMNDLVPVAVYDRAGKEIYYEKIRMSPGENRLDILVDDEPGQVVIDPHFLLIDKTIGDNRLAIR